MIDAFFLAHYSPFLTNVVASLSSPIMVDEVRAVVSAFGLYRVPGMFGLEAGVL